MILGSFSYATFLLFPAKLQAQLIWLLSFQVKKINKHINHSRFANMILPGGVQGNVVAGTVLVLWTVPWK